VVALLHFDFLLLNSDFALEELLFVRIALGDGCSFYAQGRLCHPHMLSDGAAKFLRQCSQLRFRFGREWLAAKNANARAQLFNLIFG